jgi:hypothetical protein
VGLILYWYVGSQYIGDVWTKLRSVESPPGTSLQSPKEG